MLMAVTVTGPVYGLQVLPLSTLYSRVTHSSAKTAVRCTSWFVRAVMSGVTMMSSGISLSM